MVSVSSVGGFGLLSVGGFGLLSVGGFGLLSVGSFGLLSVAVYLKFACFLQRFCPLTAGFASLTETRAPLRELGFPKSDSC